MAVVLAVVAGCTSTGEDDTGEAGPPVADLTAVPEQVTWRDYRGVAIPVGADGPREYTDAAATGFTHAPQGAALAAIVHTVRMSLAPDDHWASIAAREIAPGLGKDEWAAGRVLLSITSTADPATAPRIRGYTITHYDDSLARVRIYTSFPDSSIAINTATVVWHADDWRLQLPDPADIEPTVIDTTVMDAAVVLAR